MNQPTAILIAFLLLHGCVSDDQSNPTIYTSGIFIVNEGGFNSNSGSISHIDETGVVTQNVFLSENNRPLGDIVQSMGFFGNTGFVVVNNSQKIELVNLSDFSSKGTILGVDYPRYFISDGVKGFLSDGNFGGSVFIIDIESHSISNQILVGNGPENMLITGSRLYVANSGGWTQDSTVTVIDTQLESILKTIYVGDNPTDMVEDKNGNIWVLCKGRVRWNDDWSVIIEETESVLCRIDPSNFSTMFFTIGQTGDFYNPLRLAIDAPGKTLYFDEAQGIYSMDVDNMTPPLGAFINRNVYGLDVDPLTGIIYALVSKGVEENGWLYRYHPNGGLIDSLEVGIIPNAAVFTQL